MKYKIYYEVDDYHYKNYSNMNIESFLVGETDIKETAYNIFDKYSKRAFNNAIDCRLCVRYNTHIIDGWQTIETKNFYSRRWLREVGKLE